MKKRPNISIIFELSLNYLFVERYAQNKILSNRFVIKYYLFINFNEAQYTLRNNQWYSHMYLWSKISMFIKIFDEDLTKN